MTRTMQRYIRHSPGLPWMFCQSKHQPFHVNASFLQPNSLQQTTMLIFHQPFSKNSKSWSSHGVTSLSTGLCWILRRLKTLRKSSCIFLLRMMRWGSGNRGRSTHEIILKIALLRSTMFGEISLILWSVNKKFFHCHEKAHTHEYESWSALARRTCTFRHNMFVAWFNSCIKHCHFTPTSAQLFCHNHHHLSFIMPQSQRGQWWQHMSLLTCMSLFLFNFFSNDWSFLFLFSFTSRYLLSVSMPEGWRGVQETMTGGRIRGSDRWLGRKWCMSLFGPQVCFLFFFFLHSLMIHIISTAWHHPSPPTDDDGNTSPHHSKASDI